MSTRPDRAVGWYAMPAGWPSDDDILRLSPMAQLLLLRVVYSCATRPGGGRISGRQLRELSRDLAAKPARLVEQLVNHGVLSLAEEGQEQDTDRTVPGQEQDTRRTVPGQQQDTRRTLTGHFTRSYVLSRSNYWLPLGQSSNRNTPGQSPKSIDRDTDSLARARVKKDIKKDIPTSRPASPDGRDVGARAAPTPAQKAPTRPASEKDQKEARSPGVYDGAVRDSVGDHPALNRRRGGYPGRELSKEETLLRLKELENSGKLNGAHGGDDR